MSKEQFKRNMDQVDVTYVITRPSKDTRREICHILHREILGMNVNKYAEGKFDLIPDVEPCSEHDSSISGWGHPWTPELSQGYNWDLETNRGKLIKRIRFEMSKEVQKSDVWGKLGGLLHDSHTMTMTIDTTRRLNWRDGEFGDEGSCFWGEHTPAREAMDAHPNCGAVRSWKRGYEGEAEGHGRCWYYYDEDKDTIFIFNAYGHTKSQFASALQQIFDYPERKHYPYFHADDDGGEHLWNNSGGLLLYKPGTPTPTGENYCLHDLEIEDQDAYFCCCCERRVREDYVFTAGFEYYCEECYTDRYTTCDRCGDPESVDNVVTDREGHNWCQGCVDRGLVLLCDQCEEWSNVRHTVVIERDGDSIVFCDADCRDSWILDNPESEESNE